jgi:hypothetical protein
MTREAPGPRINSFLPSAVLTATVCVVVLSSLGCSVSITDSSRSLPLSSSALSRASSCQPVETMEEAIVYGCKEGGLDVFLTVVQDCDVKEKFSHRATTRQLLVGLSSLRVLSQEAVPIGSGKALRSVVAGILDVDPIYLSTFTLRNGSCVTDVVVWQSALEAAHATAGVLGEGTQAAIFAQASTLLAERIGSETPPGEDPQPISALSSPMARPIPSLTSDTVPDGGPPIMKESHAPIPSR